MLGGLLRPMEEAMVMKLILAMISGGLAVWMGTSFVLPVDRTPMTGPVVAPDHGDSHRLGVIGNQRVALPSWDGGEPVELSPLFGGLVRVD